MYYFVFLPSIVRGNSLKTTPHIMSIWWRMREGVFKSKSLFNCRRAKLQGTAAHLCQSQLNTKNDNIVVFPFYVLLYKRKVFETLWRTSISCVHSKSSWLCYTDTSELTFSLTEFLWYFIGNDVATFFLAWFHVHLSNLIGRLHAFHDEY